MCIFWGGPKSYVMCLMFTNKNSGFVDFESSAIKSYVDCTSWKESMACVMRKRGKSRRKGFPTPYPPILPKTCLVCVKQMGMNLLLFHLCLCSLKSANFPTHLLPVVVVPGAVAGKLQKPFLGIPAGIPVGVALGDFQCSVLSSISCQNDAGKISIILSWKNLGYNPPPPPTSGNSSLASYLP